MRRRGKNRSSWDAHRHGNCGWDARGQAPQNGEVTGDHGASTPSLYNSTAPGAGQGIDFPQLLLHRLRSHGGLGTGEARGRGWGVLRCENPADFSPRWLEMLQVVGVAGPSPARAIAGNILAGRQPCPRACPSQSSLPSTSPAIRGKAGSNRVTHGRGEETQK